MRVTTEIGCEWELLTKSEKNGRINHLLMKSIYVLLTCDFQLPTDMTQKSSGGICVSPEEPQEKVVDEPQKSNGEPDGKLKEPDIGTVEEPKKPHK